MFTTIAVLVTVLSIPPVRASSAAGVKAITEAQQSQPMTADKQGFMPWQWKEDSPSGRTTRVVGARAKLLTIKNNVVTIKTDEGRILNIPRDNVVGHRLRLWLDGEIAKQDAKSKARP